MILAIDEYPAAPASPAQWYQYYNTLDDKVYMQLLPTTDPLYPSWQEVQKGANLRDDMRHQATLTRSQYSAKDFQTYLDEIIAYISQKWGDDFNDFMASEPAMMIAEYIAASLDQMSWYLDRESSEWYMELGRIASNVATRARYLGYKPSASVAASVDLSITLPNGPYAFDIILSKGHQVEGPNSLVFELVTDKTILAGEEGAIVGAYQGQTFTERFTATGEANQTYRLSLVPDGQFLSQGKTLCTVDLDEWTEEEFLPYDDSESYELNYLASPPEIRFGTGVMGKIPPDGAEIIVTYIATAGKGAGFATSGTITKNLTTVVVNFEQIPLEVTNANPATGGADAESIASIKANAPRYFMAADRLVTESDYDILASTYSGLAGAVAKAKSLIIRGVEDDLQLNELLDALVDSSADLQNYLDLIIEQQESIQGLTGDSGFPATIRGLINLIDAKYTTIRTELTNIDGRVVTTQGFISDCRDDISLAQTRLGFLPFQELIGMGDGIADNFSITLAKTPITPGTVGVFVGDKTPTKSGSDGDCDTSPGSLISAADITFLATDVGKLIKIGGEYRQIVKFVGATTIQYSGPRIYGTALLVDVYPPAVVGYDDGEGNITGNGISGSITYASGALSVDLVVAPEGISAKYGTPVICTYQYIGEGIQSVLDDADSDAVLANDDVALVLGNTSSISDEVDSAETENASIGTRCDDIDAIAVLTITTAGNAGNIPTQIQNGIDALLEYLDEVLSGPCKANIVRVSCLTKDANGFYAEPSLALTTELKAYLDARKIRSVQNSVVSGAYYLVQVKLHIALSIADQYVFKTVKEAVEPLIDEMFKDRDYGQPLLRREYYDVVDEVDGVDYPNINITDVGYADPSNEGTPPSVDANGNLFVGKHEVITKWSVEIVEIL
jgi:hypothetical protein